MTKLPSLAGQQLISALRKAGFEVICVKGSHHFIRRPDGRCTVVPAHRGEAIGPGLLSKILRDCDMSHDDLLGLLWADPVHPASAAHGCSHSEAK